MNIGLKIKQLAQSKGMSMEKMAEVLDKKRVTMYDVIKRTHTDTEIIATLSNYFGIPISYFFADDDVLPDNFGEQQGEQHHHHAIPLYAIQEQESTGADKAKFDESERLRRLLRKEKRKREVERETYLALLKSQQATNDALLKH